MAQRPEVTLAEANCDSLAWPVVQTSKAGEEQRPAVGGSGVDAFVRSGGDDEFTALVQRYKDRVIRLAVSILGPAHAGEAEDLAQEVFVLVYRKLDTLRHEGAISTWIYRVTRNRALDRRRLARMRHPHLGDEHLDDLKAPGSRGDPEQIALAGQRRAQVLDRLERLPDTQRMVVYLHYWMDTGVKEIARLLEMNVGTVKSHLYRARQRLARELAEGSAGNA